LNKRGYILLICACFCITVKAQDPFLSQLYTSAQFLSPASVGNGIYQSRIQSNYRSQMLAGNQLYKTIVVGWDGRYKNKNEDVVNYLGIGGQIISDQVMNGVLQTNYATLNAAYHLFFDDDLKKDFSLGLGLTFAQSNLQLDKLKFGDQFSEGEYLMNSRSISLQNLNNSASKISMNTGLLYTNHSQTSFVQISANAFFFSKPDLTTSNQASTSGFKSLLFLNAEKELESKKSVLIHASFNSRNKMEQTLVGGAIGLPFGSYYENTNRIYFGLFYRLNDAVIPNFSILMNEYRFGLSYDVYSSGYSGAQIKPSSFEISFSAALGRRRADYFRTLFD
jgi:type IX secretion system PorP/SprF family membrane protein